MSPVTFTGKATPLSQAGFNEVVTLLESDAASLWALLTVETSGFGFFPDRRPKILFERHVFHRRTGGRFSSFNSRISSSVAGGYTKDAAEYERLGEAILVDRNAALDSASWGLGQIMGFNARSLKYADAEQMINLFQKGEDEQLDGSFRFIMENSALSRAFRNRQWDRVAFYYNGSNYAKNRYDELLARYFLKYSTEGVPSIEIRAAQARLTFLGYSPKGIDGTMGPNTARELKRFQKDQGLAITGMPDDVTLQALVDVTGT